VTNLETASRVVVRFYKQAGDGGAMDQGGQAGGEKLKLSAVDKGALIAFLKTL
jgi:hypothetical protein